IDGELAGGLYGVSLGRFFFGESMFTRRTDASKIALAALIAFCREHAIETIDCQQRTAHLASFGGRELPRAEFMARLGAALALQPVADWTYDLRMWSQLGIDIEGASAS
ncbi:MAG TPA: leucyl/phenylalanyl-tRNA--protein transferase, partial [Caldimonas sp.]|nr:leucyl/phenylalanyl-tRNA--protein transferase [Caldimonas sp.]